MRDERNDVFFIKSLRGFQDLSVKQPADYILMEYEQNFMEGDAMIREMRACSGAPLIVYSYSGMDFREKSLAAGASVYLGKPQNSSAIVTAIREFEIEK